MNNVTYNPKRLMESRVLYIGSIDPYNEVDKGDYERKTGNHIFPKYINLVLLAEIYKGDVCVC